MSRRRGVLAVCASAAVVCGFAPLVAASPLVHASITAESEPSGLQLTSSIFFADESLSLSYTVDVNTPEITEPTTVSTTPPAVTVIDRTTSESSTEAGTGRLLATSPASTIEIAPPGIQEPAVIVRVALHRPLNGASLSEVVSGDAGPVIDVVTGPLQRFAARDAITNNVSLNIDLPLQARVGYRSHLDDVLEYVDSGITPVSVSVLRGTSVIAHDVTLIDVGWKFVDAAPLAVSTVAQIVGRSSLVTPSDHALPDSDVARATLELQRLSELLQQTNIPLTLAFSPELVAPLEAGTLAASVTGAAVDRLLMDNGGELLSLPYRKIDPSAAATAGEESRFVTELDSGDLALQSAFPSFTPTRTVWLLDDRSTTESITEAGLQLLRSVGAERLLMSAHTYAGGPLHDGLDATRPGQVLLGDVSLPVTIAREIGELHDRSSGTPMDHAVMAAAQITERRRAQPDIARSIVLISSDFSVPDPALLSAVEQLLVDDPTIEFLRLSQVPFEPPYNRPIVEPQAPVVDLSQRQLTADSLRDLINDTGSMLTTDNELIRRWNNLLEDLFDDRGSGQFVVDIIDIITAETAEVRQRVSIPMSGTVNLTGRNTPLPLIIENSGSEPLSVLVHLVAPRLIVPTEPISTVLLPGTNSLQIPVEARSNGSFAVEVEVLSPVNTSVVSGVTITAKAMTLSGFGRLVGFGLILVLLSWWASHLRQQRRSREQNSSTVS
jgi:hypothetical protein